MRGEGRGEEGEEEEDEEGEEDREEEGLGEEKEVLFEEIGIPIEEEQEVEEVVQVEGTEGRIQEVDKRTEMVDHMIRKRAIMTQKSMRCLNPRIL